MSQIQIIKYTTTHLNSAFDNNVGVINVPKDPFSEGAFGVVYRSTINGVKQVVKIFKSDGRDAAVASKKCYSNILSLQKAVIDYNTKLKANGSKPIEKVNALYALPLFSFEGTLNGKTVLGYSTNDLDGDWLFFDKLFESASDPSEATTLRKWFYEDISHEFRLNFIKDLLEGFMILEDMNFVYADLNPKNFFINTLTGALCLIDYDSGAINAEPDTIGKDGDWLASELTYGHKMTSNLFTDYWSVAMTVHYFYFPFSPFSFLYGQNESQMRDYFKKNRYPNINVSDKNYNQNFPKIRYQAYLEFLELVLPPKIKEAFIICFNEGYFNPGARPTSKQWYMRVTPLVKNYVAPVSKMPGSKPKPSVRPYVSPTSASASTSTSTSTSTSAVINSPWRRPRNIIIAIVVLVVGILACKLLIYPLFESRKAVEISVSVDYGAMIPGTYSAIQEYNGAKQGKSLPAEVRKGTNDDYEIVVVGEYDPEFHKFVINSDSLVSSTTLGSGVIRYNKVLDKLTLTFNKDNFIWVFTR